MRSTQSSQAARVRAASPSGPAPGGTVPDGVRADGSLNGMAPKLWRQTCYRPLRVPPMAAPVIHATMSSTDDSAGRRSATTRPWNSTTTRSQILCT